MNVIAAKAVALGEALQPDFVTYIEEVLDNAKVFAESLIIWSEYLDYNYLMCSKR
ncbi:hypothetical protein CG775_08690 [Paenibacillus polymyxa]|nr:hypothetical protein CG775_08690 [Paenibacillus polymyxa]